jgi:hypothetical protein
MLEASLEKSGDREPYKILYELEDRPLSVLESFETFLDLIRYFYKVLSNTYTNYPKIVRYKGNLMCKISLDNSYFTFYLTREY